MKSNKGISMISLVITIIVMAILLSVAYRIGSRYITSARQQEVDALTAILSSAVQKRQKDNFIGIAGAKSYYSGYLISSGDFDKVYPFLDEKSSIYEPGLWYFIDAVKAEDLGVNDSNKYLVNDIYDIENEDGKYLAVANYYTSKVELLSYDDIKNMEIDISRVKTDDSGVHGPGGHEPVWTVATCTEPSVCKECGMVNQPALGHKFNVPEATCTLDKVCENCGYIEAKATGHDYDTSRLEYDGSKGHYNPCTKCGAPGNFEKHTLHYSSTLGNNKWQHNVWCEKADGTKCGYSAIEECNLEFSHKNENVHIQRCTDCGREAETPHDSPPSYKYYDRDYHILCCKSCDTEFDYQRHIDVKAPYGICDECKGLTDTSRGPSVKIKMQNKSETENEDKKYVAKLGDIIEVVIETDMVLLDSPTITVQDKVINKSDIVKDEESNNYVANINTKNYEFEDGLLSVQVTNVKTLWGVEGSDVNKTDDNKYVDYDGTVPSYIYIE